MLMKYVLCTIIASLLLISCSQQDRNPEEEGSRLIHAARTLMLSAQYQEAKDSILLIRQQYPTAFKARATGIIVLDSIELLESQDSLALLNERLNAEENLLQLLEEQNPTRRTSEFYAQRTKVFYLKQHVDEISAKVKFFLRKIEIDINKNLQNK